MGKSKKGFRRKYEVINYIGDITFDWHGMGSGSGFAIAAISPILSATVTCLGNISNEK